MGVGALIWVCDMADAYRKVLVHPAYHHFLGFQWQKCFCYSCLPFGVSSSCQIYSEFADCLRMIVVKSNPEWFRLNAQILLLNYLDDFFCGHRIQQLLGSSTMSSNVGWNFWVCLLAHISALIRVLLQKFWVFGMIHSFKMFSIPQAKVEKISKLIDSLLALTRHLSRSEVSSLVGKLTWASQAICCSRIVLFNLRKLVNVRIDWDKKSLRLSAAARADLRWWKATLNSYGNGIPFEWF